MKQIAIRSGQPTVIDSPAPSPESGLVLVANAASVISSGTERAAVSAGGGGGSLPMRAIRNPDLVMKTLKYAKEHGVRETMDLVKATVGEDAALGYSSAGIVLHTGGMAEFKVGDRVACAGAGNANHAEVVAVPGNLVAHVPENVDLRHAAFTTLGAIAIQGVRRAQPTLGEHVVVAGLGLLGLITVQILKASGCQVLGIEPTESRRKLAEQFGADLTFAPGEGDERVKDWTGGNGADAVIVTASSSGSEIANGAIAMLRRKGRVVIVGDVGMHIERPDIYQREADFLISTSYGPGRYDPSYEQLGVDYPIAYVRWTENRNMQEFLRLVSTGQVDVAPLIEIERAIEQAGDAYAAVNGDTPPLAAVLTYDTERATQIVESRETVRIGSSVSSAKDKVTVAIVGAGGFVKAMHIPNLKAEPTAEVKLVVTRSSTSATSVARLIDAPETSTDWHVAVEDPEIDLVLVGTRHDTHAEISAAALKAGKAVFVEKPLGLTREEIDSVWEAGRENDRLAVGFNRTFAPLAQKMGDQIRQAGGPIHLIYRVSAPLPHNHWLNDPKEGGGRILGEGCHMFDFASWLCGTPVRVSAAALPAAPDLAAPESTSVTIEYANGSVATVHYSGVGAGSMPKERIEVLCGGRSWVLEDFRSLTTYDADGESVEEERRQDKGHAELLKRVLAACRGEQKFEPGLEAAYVAQSIGLAALESIESAQTVAVQLPAER